MTEKLVDERTDLYNFGATMYRMFTGRYANTGGPPKVGENPKIKLAPPSQLNPKVPAQLSDLILACLQTSPDRRPASMFEVHRQIAEVAKFLGLEQVSLKLEED